MPASCSCLKMNSVAVALFNLALGIYILIEGIFLLQDYLHPTRDMTIGFVIVDFQVGTFLVFVGILLLLGIFQNNERHISLYLLLSSLIWFVITTLSVSYMIFYNTTQELSSNPITTPVPIMEPTTTVAPKPKETVPVGKAVGFSMGLIAIWCGQLGVYKYHDQVIEKEVINTGQSYVSSAIYSS